MLKTWLTRLQPGVSGLGILLLVASPLCSLAAPKPKAFTNSKIPSQQPQWSVASIGSFASGETNSNRNAPSIGGIAATPDVAVRQLALNAMSTTGMPSKTATHIRKDSRSAVSGLHAPSIRSHSLSARAMPTAPVVPGIFIGNSDVRMPSQFLPTAARIAPRTVAEGKAIGSPTSMSAVMATTNINAGSPFPVVTPALMQKLNATSTVASARSAGKRVQSLDPLAVMNSGASQKGSKFIDSNAVASTQLQPGMAKSFDPIASIPSGLQRFLGNDINGEARVATKAVAKTNGSHRTVAKAANAKANLFAVLQPLSKFTNSSDVSAPNLQLATAQAYTSVPKFSIPGDRVSSSYASGSHHAPVVARPKTNVATSSDRYLGMSLRQSWMTISQRNNLGGLILGSQAMSTDTRRMGLDATSTVKASSNGSLTFNLDKFN
jgi:hypothetical protein